MSPCSSSATTLTRLPFAINGLALILFLREATGSFAVAGLDAGALALAAASPAPFAARLVDRRGPRSGCCRSRCVHARRDPVAPGASARSTPRRLRSSPSRSSPATSFPPSRAPCCARAGPSSWRRCRAGPRRLRVRLRHDRDLVRQRPAHHGRHSSRSSGPEAAMALSSAALQVAERRSSSRDCPSRAARSRRVSTPPDWDPSAVGAPAIRHDRPDHDPRWLLHRRVEVGDPGLQRGRGHAALSGVLLSLWSLASGSAAWSSACPAVTGRAGRQLPRDRALFPLATLPLVAAGSSPATMARS